MRIIMAMFTRLRPHLLFPRLVDVPHELLLAQGISGVILDLDNTLTPWHTLLISADVERWIARMRQCGLQACIVSNAATGNRVRPVAERLGLPWVTRAAKPLPFGFQRGMQLMDTPPEATAIIGDQLFTDVYGGNALGLLTILVDPLTPRESIVTRLLQRPLERLIGRTAKGLEPNRR